MKLSGEVEWALHCCVVLTTATEPVPAVRAAAERERRVLDGLPHLAALFVKAEADDAAA